MNKTPNCQLSQWALTDPVRMDDFNSDNLKLDGELARLRENLFSLAYCAGLEAINHQLQGNPIIPQLPISTCCFYSIDQVALEGGVSVSNHVATLSGKGASGSLTFRRSSFIPLGLTAKTARLWVHNDRQGTITPYLNGVEMTEVKKFMSLCPTLSDCWCTLFTLDTPFTENPQVRVELDCGSSSSMKAADMILAQF